MLRAAFITAFLLSWIAATLLFGIAQAQSSIPKPSIPEFTLKYIDNSYDIPPSTTSTTNPYTNETTTATIPFHHVENKTIEITITNQPFASLIDGNATNLYYTVRTKGGFEEDWSNTYSSSLNSASSSGVLLGDYSISLPTQSSSEYTVLSFPAYSYPSNGVVDFQVEAILGYQYSYDEYFYNQQPHLVPLRVNIFVYESSGWSNTRNITVSASQTPTPSPATTPSPLPTPYEIPIIGVAFIVIVFGAGLGLLIYLIKRK